MPEALPVNPFILVFNSVALALSLAFLIILVWYDLKRMVTQFFLLFLLSVITWQASTMTQSLMSVSSPSQSIASLIGSVVDLGYLASSITLYALVTVVTEVQPRLFRALVLGSLIVITMYAVFLIVISSDAGIITNIQTSVAVIFVLGTLYLLWRYRNKIINRIFFVGVAISAVGQLAAILNPELGITTLSNVFLSLGSVVLGFAIMDMALIQPLVSRSTQLESLHEVNRAMIGQIATDAVLLEIAREVAEWIRADATAIFLIEDSVLRLVASHSLPNHLVGQNMGLGDGVVGYATVTKKAVIIGNYQRDWSEKSDLPSINQSFGSVIACPLVYGGEVIGALLAIAGKQGRLFDQEDLRLIELLSAQASVTVSQAQNFKVQKALANQLRETNSQLAAVLESTLNPVLVVDRKLRLMFANSAAQDVFRLNSEDRQRLVTQLLDYDLLPKNYRLLLRTVAREGVYVYEVTISRKSYIAYITRLGHKKVEGWVAVLNDVTDLIELDRIKSEMIRMTSHDLKNPLQAAMANLDLIREDVIEYIPDEERHAGVVFSLDKLERQLEKMNRIIGGILDLERLRLGPRLDEICFPKDIVKSIIDELSSFAHEKHVSLSTDIAEDVGPFAVDRSQFERAMINLVENAIKFCKSEGQVVVKVYQDADDILFVVKDDGIGIPAHLHAKIFERFFRGRQAGAEHISGTGLGLSLVKTVVENHNGRIWLESREGEGTTFYVAVQCTKREISHSH